MASTKLRKQGAQSAISHEQPASIGGGTATLRGKRQQNPGKPQRLDSTKFSSGEYIDRVFSTPSGIEGIDVVTENLEQRLRNTNREIHGILQTQTATSGNDEAKSLERTKDAIGELYVRISEMKRKAEVSERMVFDITQDIKALDFAKRNISITMSVMKRLQILISAVGELKCVVSQQREGNGDNESSKYYEAADLVKAVNGLIESLAGYTKIKQISSLVATTRSLQSSLSVMVREEIERGFDDAIIVGDIAKMQSACVCADALGTKDEIIEFYCSIHLKAYSNIFQLHDDVSQLENVSRRYAWMRRILRNYTDQHKDVFPSSWRVDLVLCKKLCVLTRDQLGEVLAVNGESVSVDHLMSALSDTLSFESQCNKRFSFVATGVSDDDDAGADSNFISPGLNLGNNSGSRDNGQEYGGYDVKGDEHRKDRILSSESLLSTMSPSASSSPLSTFTGLVSCAFEPYLSIFIKSEEGKFQKKIERYQVDPISLDEDDASSLNVLASSTDMFYQYRESLRQCASITTGQTMLDLSKVFGKYMSRYARDVLIHKYPRLDAKSANAASVLEELRHVCLIINTADYCASMMTQLEQKIVERIDSEFKEKVNFEMCKETLLGCINAGVKVLVTGTEALCEPSFESLMQEPWQSMEMVGDQSNYVLLVASALEAAAETVRHNLTGTRYFRSYCDKFVIRFIERYTASILGCGRISEMGAEQLLLDSQVLKSVLTELASLGSDTKVPVPAAYSKIVTNGVGNIEAMLKAILAPDDPPDALVDRFLLVFPKAPTDVFLQVLKLKGVKQSNQHVFLKRLKLATAAAAAAAAAAASSQTPSRDDGGSGARTEKTQHYRYPHTGPTTPIRPADKDIGQTTTPENNTGNIPGHITQMVSASAPTVRKQGLHNQGSKNNHGPQTSESTVEHTRNMSGGTTLHTGTSHRGLHFSAVGDDNNTTLDPDPLGITGAVTKDAKSQRHTITHTDSDKFGTGTTRANEEGNSSADPLSPPVLASLAANATATRSKINENLRRFMSTMRRN